MIEAGYKNSKKKILTLKNRVYILLLFVSILFLGLGYASINNISLNISGLVSANPQEGLFITDVSYLQSNKADLENTKIISIYQNNLNSKIVLENDKDAIFTYQVNIHNSTNSAYLFNGVEYIVSEQTYSNENIIFELNGLEIGDIVESNDDINFTISFKYKDVPITDCELVSLLNFKFDIAKYVIAEFDGNGGEVTTSSKLVIVNKPYGELPIPVREGYTFSGWAVEKTGKELITENSIVETEIDHKLYAQWNAKSYTIKYHANGGEGTMVDQVIKYDAVVPLSKNTFTKTGYSFFGWATTADGEKAYNDTDNVVNLLLEGTVDLYALWVEDSYTVTFDYNGGIGSVSSMQVLYGQTYGTLPEYPYLQDNIFIGWYTAKTGGTQVFSTSTVNIKENHTLYAQWESIQYNDAIQNVVAKNAPDLNQDGIIDSIYLSFTCSSSFEKYNIPIKNLVVGQKYRLKYTASNNASFGDIESGYKNSMYGSMITTTASLSSGSIKTEAIAAGGLIAQWSDYSKGDIWLNGPFNMEMVFTAEATNMYWTWDFGLMEDGILYDFNITNIVLEPVVPTIEFSNKNMILHTTSAAQILDDESNDYSSNFIFDGDGYAETIYYPITGLSSGSTYTITFEHLYNGRLIDDSASTTNIRYEYGTGIMSTIPTKYGSFMTSIGTFASNTFIKKTVTGTVDTVTLTFTASSSTMYWVWNMANCSDSYNNEINIKVTKFSVSHNNGGQMIYHNESS